MAIKKSVFPDHIVCLEDGRKMKVLKRHLAFKGKRFAKSVFETRRFFEKKTV